MYNKLTIHIPHFRQINSWQHACVCVCQFTFHILGKSIHGSSCLSVNVCCVFTFHILGKLVHGSTCLCVCTDHHIKQQSILDKESCSCTNKKSNRAQLSSFTACTCTKCHKTLLLDYRATSRVYIPFESNTLKKIPRIEEGFINTHFYCYSHNRTPSICSPKMIRQERVEHSVSRYLYFTTDVQDVF